MWTPTTRAQHYRDGLRVASDVTDDEWAVLEPLLPARDMGQDVLHGPSTGRDPWRRHLPGFNLLQKVVERLPLYRDFLK